MHDAEKIEAQLVRFHPQTKAESSAKAQAMRDCQQAGEKLLYREAPCHFTASALVCDPTLTKVLMVHHNLYRTFAWPGGHVDGSADFLVEAIREVREETGVETVIPVSSAILSLDILPVPPQEKKGVLVPAHTHYSVGFGCIVSGREKLRIKPDENTAVEWIPVEELAARSGEPHMIAIYEKILRRMQDLWKAKRQIYKKLPGLLIPWYRQNARKLPWRQDKEPYHVWLSEIMLQQTRVEAVKAYYLRFLKTLPTIASLAACDEETLLKLWEGLGYYSRVRNLQKAAVSIEEKHSGQFPARYDDILALPGVGAYTAGAVSSICFEQPIPAVDGNVLRVISRLTEEFTPIDSPQLKKEITERLAAVYPAGACGDFTQSLMELGATVCVPNGRPRCGECPVQPLCMACQNGVQEMLPVKKKKAARRVEKKTVFLLRCGDRIAVERRQEQGVLHGLWQFPNTVGHRSDQVIAPVLAQWGIPDFSLERVVARKHIFTHIEWEMMGYYLECTAMPSRFTWVTAAELEARIALPTAFRMFWEDER